MSDAFAEWDAKNTPPTPKQLEYAEIIADSLNIKMPAKITRDSITEFITKNKEEWLEYIFVRSIGMDPRGVQGAMDLPMPKWYSRW